MTYILKIIATIIFTLSLTNCAGSANHEIVSEFQAQDVILNCAEIKVELDKAQSVIDGVKKISTI